TLLLPRARALPVAARPDTLTGRGNPRRRWRILVVDDDRDVRAMTGEMLAERGYAVEQAADAAEALAMLDRDSGFDAVPVDYVMPGMNGVAMIQALQRVRPALRTMLMTGHAEEEAGETIGVDNIIRKPFTISTLDERLERMLSRPILRTVQGGVAD